MKNEHDEQTSFTRRTVLSGSATLAAATMLSGQASAAPRAGTTRPVLVHVFLRGGMDGLTLVPPYGDAHLYIRRPSLAIQPPGQPNGALDLDGFFGLAPKAAPLLTPYSAGHLAFVQACGSDDATRSHFEAFVRMESGDSTLPTGVITTGWITRYLLATAAQATANLRAIGNGALLPFTLRGAPKALPIPNLATFSFPGRPLTALDRQAIITDAYALESPPVGPAALDTMEALGLGGIDFVGYVPANGAVYPASPLGVRMRQTATLIKAAIGVEVVTIDVDGWDLHAQLGPISGNMANLMDNLSKSIEAFYIDMLGNMDDYMLVCVSEFGRHCQQNGSAGTDHGHGNAMFIMGGGVNGGQVIANWPGLRPVDLDQGDLAITIDYRDILGEMLIDRFAFPDLSQVFPQLVLTEHGVTT